MAMTVLYNIGKEKMRLQRLLLVLFYMREHKLVKVDQLADMLEISRRTIYRDIDELRTAGADIIGIPGTGGGYKLSDSFKMEELLFSQSELLSMNLGTELLSNYRGTNIAGQAEISSEKLLKLLQNPERKKSLVIDTSDRFAKSGDNNMVKIWERAISDGTSVRITYRSPLCEQLSTDGLVDPYGLVNKAGYWFLVGYCHQLECIRAFNTANIKGIIIAGKSYIRNKTFDLTKFWETVKPK